MLISQDVNRMSFSKLKMSQQAAYYSLQWAVCSIFYALVFHSEHSRCIMSYCSKNAKNISRTKSNKVVLSLYWFTNWFSLPSHRQNENAIKMMHHIKTLSATMQWKWAVGQQWLVGKTASGICFKVYLLLSALTVKIALRFQHSTAVCNIRERLVHGKVGQSESAEPVSG